MSRRHFIEGMPKVALVLRNDIQGVTKTSAAKDIMAVMGDMDDVIKADESNKIWVGKDKMRNRCCVSCCGLLVVYASNNGMDCAFRNLLGFELCNISCLDLLQLAHGGHLSPLCV